MQKINGYLTALISSEVSIGVFFSFLTFFYKQEYTQFQQPYLISLYILYDVIINHDCT